MTTFISGSSGLQAPYIVLDSGVPVTVPVSAALPTTSVPISSSVIGDGLTGTAASGMSSAYLGLRFPKGDLIDSGALLAYLHLTTRALSNRNDAEKRRAEAAELRASNVLKQQNYQMISQASSQVEVLQGQREEFELEVAVLSGQSQQEGSGAQLAALLQIISNLTASIDEKQALSSAASEFALVLNCAGQAQKSEDRAESSAAAKSYEFAAEKVTRELAEDSAEEVVKHALEDAIVSKIILKNADDAAGDA